MVSLPGEKKKLENCPKVFWLSHLSYSKITFAPSWYVRGAWQYTNHPYIINPRITTETFFYIAPTFALWLFSSHHLPSHILFLLHCLLCTKNDPRIETNIARPSWIILTSTQSSSLRFKVAHWFSGLLSYSPWVGISFFLPHTFVIFSICKFYKGVCNLINMEMSMALHHRSNSIFAKSFLSSPFRVVCEATSQ